MRAIFLIIFIAFGSSAAMAQDFPWEIFQPRTLAEMTAVTTKAVRPDDALFLATNLLESKSLVTFTGRSRPLPTARKNFLNIWCATFNQPKEYAPRYESEYLYKDGDTDYWLATQTPVAKYFARELKPGDKITLYMISIGAYRAGAGMDCVFLVEEFQSASPPAG
jgi:hypothetical protein